MRNYKKILVGLSLCLGLTACSGGEVERVNESIKVSPGEELQKSMIEVDNSKKPQAPIDFTPKEITPDRMTSSVYQGRLSVEKQNIYSELYNTVINFGENYIPSSNLSEEEATNMMRIILLDEPLAYALKKDYSYELNGDGNVSKINLEYHPLLSTKYAKMQIDRMKAPSNNNMEDAYSLAVFSNLVSNLSYIGDEPPTNTYIMTFLENSFKSEPLDTSNTDDNGDLLIDRNDDGIDNDKEISPDELQKLYDEYKQVLIDSYFAPELFKQASEEGVAKAFSYLLRSHSMSALTIYGERTSTRDDEFIDYREYKEYNDNINKEGNTVKVTVDSTGLNAWNMFKVSDSFYHADVLISKSIIDLTENESMIYGFGIKDEQSSSSKLSYPNEEILGVYPMSYDDLMNSARKSSNIFMDDTNTTRYQDELAKKIAEVDNRQAFAISFSDK